MEFGVGLLLHLYRFHSKRQLTPVRFVHDRAARPDRGVSLLRMQGRLRLSSRWLANCMCRCPKTENCGTGQTSR
jgi:hypothetical protein